MRGRVGPDSGGRAVCAGLGVVVLVRGGPPAEGAVLAGQSPESWGAFRTVNAVDHAFTLPAI
ncbi:hypothetical protein [Streptomyces rhizosphaericus]|uniref:hypothetical protein n=1 Tax=Streptomyces rhizosphaericus TaxID=114699 RepID=UPI0036313823